MTHAPSTTDFRRENLPLWERLTSGILLVLLTALGVWIFFKGKTYDPARYLPTAGEEAPAASSGSSWLTELAGLPSLSEPEVYSPETLYEKINGRAPAYLDFGFQTLTCRTFAVPDHPEDFVDVFVFTMGSPLDAFGIYSMENVGEGVPVDFVADGVRGGLGVYFRKGDAYVQVNGSSAAAPVQQVVERLARELADRLPENEQGLEAKMTLTLTGMKPGSLTYIRENAYGQESLREVFEVTVERQGLELPVFVMRAASPEDARGAFGNLMGFNQRFGTLHRSEEGNWFVGESFGQFAAVYVDGRTVGGSMNAGSLAAAEQLLRELREQGE